VIIPRRLRTVGWWESVAADFILEKPNPINVVMDRACHIGGFFGPQI